MHRLQELVRLYRLGEGARSIARQLQMSPNTERDYRNALKEAGLLEGDAESLPELSVLKLAIEAHKPSRPPPQYESSVERWREQVEALVAAGAAPKAIFDRLRLEHNKFKGSPSAIKRMVASVTLPPRDESAARSRSQVAPLIAIWPRGSCRPETSCPK